jgi:hypothetical protein
MDQLTALLLRDVPTVGVVAAAGTGPPVPPTADGYAPADVLFSQITAIACAGRGLGACGLVGVSIYCSH